MAETSQIRALIPFGMGLICAALLASCKFGDDKAVQASPEEQKIQAIRTRGRQTYMANCTVCHASDPKMDGPVGPAVAGSSLELIRLRVLEVKYPEGYKPKRDTHAMVALPHLKDEIEALYQYLNQGAEK